MKKALIVKVREFVRLIILSLQHVIFTRLYRMNISSSARISFRTYLDKTHPKGIHIGDESYIEGGGVVGILTSAGFGGSAGGAFVSTGCTGTEAGTTATGSG